MTQIQLITKLASNKVKKVNCPSCGAKGRYQQYINILTGEVLPSHFGKCDRISKCGHHENPDKAPNKYTYNQLKGLTDKEYTSQIKAVRRAKIEPKKIHLPSTLLDETINTNHNHNTFTNYLYARADNGVLDDVLNAYCVGSVPQQYKGWNTACTFPFITYYGNLRAIQCKQFDKDNHTIKGKTNFLHAVILNQCNNKSEHYLTAYNESEQTKVSCFFGEHLLKKYKCNPVVLVESPKTALYLAIDSGGLPKSDTDPLYLATVGLTYFTANRCEYLQGRKVLLCADIGCYDQWETLSFKINETYPSINFVMSEWYEGLDVVKGDDIGDFIEFSPQEHTAQTQPPQDANTETHGTINRCSDDRANRVSKYTLDQVDTMFDNIKELPLSIKLDGFKISNVKQFINTHIAQCKAMPVKASKPYFDRLVRLHEVLTDKPIL